MSQALATSQGRNAGGFSNTAALSKAGQERQSRVTAARVFACKVLGKDLETDLKSLLKLLLRLYHEDWKVPNATLNPGEILMKHQVQKSTGVPAPESFLQRQ